MSMKLANDIQAVTIRVEQLEHHVANLRQVVDTIMGVVQRLEKEMAENGELLKELVKLKGALILKTGPKNVRGKEANG